MGSSVILPSPGQPKTGPDTGFRTAANPNVVTFAWQGIGPPSPIYIQRDDVLIVVANTNRAVDTVVINLRLLLTPTPSGGQPDQLPQGQVAPSGPSNTIVTVQQFLQIPNITAAATFTIPLAEGYLLSLTARGNSNQTRGMTFVRMILLRGGPGLNQSAYVLASDYVTANNAIGWPGGRQIDPTESSGFVHSIQQANPAAATDWTFTAGTFQRLAVRSFSATFTASATVANRNISVIIDDGANIVFQSDVSAAVTAGQAVSVNATSTNQPIGIVTTTLFAIIPPGLILAPGWRIRSSTAGISAGDQWSAIWLGVEEWLTNV